MQLERQKQSRLSPGPASLTRGTPPAGSSVKEKSPARCRAKSAVRNAPRQSSHHPPKQHPTWAILRLKLGVRGAVQGVGFRPFIYRLATGLGLAGWVNNSSQGVSIEVEGPRPQLEAFLLRLEPEKPPRSFINSLESSWLDPAGYRSFTIRPSVVGGPKTTLVLPDIATCPECLREMADPQNRRFRYPFTNCTNCGPRFSIIESVPYDRPGTTMRLFALCSQCQAEYDNPRDRRFHAQPNACPACGPHLELWNPAGEAIFGGQSALLAAANALRRGRIVAVKGIGGFQLLVDARNEHAVRRLRSRKHREEKPFALMFSSLASVKEACEVSALEARLLQSPEAPIVLLRRVPQAPDIMRLADGIAPGNPHLGVMLPANPLHHLLMAAMQFPVVATSGNASDEPVCTDENLALELLGGIADVFLVHNRPIARQVDDSIVRVMLGREMMIRRARGYAPLPILLDGKTGAAHLPPILAVGAHLKNSIALAVAGEVFLSQHIGDLETDLASQAFRRVVSDFQELFAASAAIVAADLHPDYLSTRFANEMTVARRVGVQHHVAHVLSCLTENETALPALGVSWDGTGLGSDGTIWGGEFFHVTRTTCERVAHLRTFRLPGGDRAVRESRRAALGLLWEMSDDTVFERPDLKFSPQERVTLKAMLQNKINSPLTSSVGRLFDAVGSLTGLRHHTHFEGQTAMELEFSLDGIATDEAYKLFLVEHDSTLVLDWGPMVEAVCQDIANGMAVKLISAKFHNGLAEGIVAVARRLGLNRVALSGGCFQNRYLAERAVRRLRAEGFQPYWHQRVPPNDGGIALGQIAAALRSQPLTAAD